MSAFSIDEYVTSTMLHFNKRTEAHGGDKKHAVDLKWAIDGPNTILAKFPGLLDAMYEPNDTEDIPGEPTVRPNLRTGHWIKGPHNIVYESSGCLLTVKDGPISGDHIEMPSTDLKKFQWEPKGGNGFGRLTFNSQHVGLDQATMGRLAVLDQRQVELLVAPASLQSGTLPEKKLSKAEAKAKAKADAQAAFTSPFKFGLGDKGELVDRSPVQEKDKDEPDAGDAFAANETAGLNKPAKKVAAKKTKARTGKG